MLEQYDPWKEPQLNLKWTWGCYTVILWNSSLCTWYHTVYPEYIWKVLAVYKKKNSVSKSQPKYLSFCRISVNITDLYMLLVEVARIPSYVTEK